MYSLTPHNSEGGFHGRPLQTHAMRCSMSEISEAAERFECDPWEEMILAHIETTQTDRLTVAGLLSNVIDKKAPARADSARVKAILQRLGYVEKKSNSVRYYIKAD